ncbi:diacylglycerol kinase family protein [Streptomyces sp. NPDC060194]|uniref:diacylglycerol kinase family protein n=1 Tax=Streptomyces sp. NPDC060194 TaxID=3347069 RepID=UPI00365A54D2
MATALPDGSTATEATVALPSSGPAAAPAKAAPRRLPAALTLAAFAAARIATSAVRLAALMVGFGLLITGPADTSWPLTEEDDLNQSFERMRTATGNTVSAALSTAADTQTVIAITALVCLGLLVIPRVARRRDAAFLAASVAVQSAVFLVITMAVERQRPDVERLDDSPPTSSFTSGHTGAATALYVGLAFLVLSRVRAPWRRIVAGLLLVIPVLVAVSRLYRGMHHPTDVVFGAANGILALLLVGRAVLTDTGNPARGRTPVEPLTTGLPTGPTTVVHNPTVTDTATLDSLRRVLTEHGRHDVEFVPTTADDTGGGQASAAARAGATLVVVCGGDGTVRAVADALAGTGVPLAVVPCGTGNLLARNLGLPLTPAKALRAALDGAPRPLDLGWVEGEHLPGTHFTAMAGAGLDAAMLDRTDDRAKSALGWPAYVLAGLRELRSPSMRVTIRLDDAPALRRTARMVLVANIGTVQGGMSVVPAAAPDDGLLDVAVYDPRGADGWLRVVGALLRGPRRAPEPASAQHLDDTERVAGGRPVEYFTCRRAELTFAVPQPCELDGDTAPPGRRLLAEIRPAALTVLLPRNA